MVHKGNLSMGDLGDEMLRKWEPKLLNSGPVRRRTVLPVAQSTSWSLANAFSSVVVDYTRVWALPATLGDLRIGVPSPTHLPMGWIQ